jgi:hypothetical protein
MRTATGPRRPARRGTRCVFKAWLGCPMVAKRGPWNRLRPGARCTIGTPSAWIFLVRLHACGAGLRFSRQEFILPWRRTRPNEQAIVGR